MMKALVFSGEEKNLVVVNKDIPLLENGEVLVRLKAAAMNRRDYFIAKRMKERLETEPDFIVPTFTFGSDGSGVIEEISEGVTNFKKGDAVVINTVINEKIIGGVYDGTFAEFIKVPASNLVPKPDELSFAEAAALPMAMMTAWRTIYQANLKKGETVFIHGIGGGVALNALQIANAMGARVLVSSGSEEKLQQAKEIGAAHAVNYKKQNVTEVVKKLTDGLGVDVVIDGIGASTFQTSLEIAKVRGRVIPYGLVSGSDITFNANLLFMKEISVIGTDVMYTEAQFKDAIEFFTKHQIKPQVSKIYTLENAHLALKDIEVSNQFGKIVFEI
jgi:zinc-binding alcohol dehydrogenase/oxidoreductase